MLFLLCSHIKNRHFRFYLKEPSILSLNHYFFLSGKSFFLVFIAMVMVFHEYEDTFVKSGYQP